MSLSGVRLRSATTQLLTKIEQDGIDTYFFFAPSGILSEYVLETDSFQTLSMSEGTLYAHDDCTIITFTPSVHAVITLRNQQNRVIRLVP